MKTNALVLLFAAGCAHAQISLIDVRHCGGVGLDWSSDLGSDYYAALGGPTSCGPFTAGDSVSAFTSRGFEPGRYCESRFVGTTAPAGPLTGGTPALACMYRGFVTTNGQRYNCGDGWAYGLFSSGSDSMLVRFTPAAVVYWSARISWANVARTGCLSGASWTFAAPGLNAGAPALGRGTVVYSGSVQNTSQIEFGFSAGGSVSAAGNYGSPGWQGDTINAQATLEVFLSGVPFTPPPPDDMALPATGTTSDRDGNGIADANELFGLVQNNGNGAGFARASVGGNAGAAATLVSDGYRVVDDFFIDIPPTDAGKVVNEIVFRTAETPASNPLGEFAWNGVVNLALLRDNGAGQPALETGNAPFLELNLSNGGGTTITRTALGTSYNFQAILGGTPLGAANGFEYRISNPQGLFMIPPAADTHARWWIGFRPASSSGTSGAAMLKRAFRAAGTAPAMRYRPDPTAGAPDYSFNSLPGEVCTLSGAFECPALYGAGNIANDLYFTLTCGRDLNANGVPDDLDDCNGNGQDDFVDLITGVAADVNLNRVPDECEFRCVADFNQDGGVDGGDVDAFFAAWEGGDPHADVNQDGGIDGADVSTFFAAWEVGSC